MMISALLIISRAMVPPPLLLAVVPSRQAAFQRSAAPGVSGRRAGLLVAQNHAPARVGSTQMATGQLATSALENAATWPNWAAVAHVQPGLFVLLLGWLAVKGQLERQAAADVAPVPQAVSRTADIAVKLGFPAWGKPLSEEETLLMVIERDLTWSLSITFIVFGSIGFGMGWATGPAMSGVLDIVDPQVVPVISAIGVCIVSYAASLTVSKTAQAAFRLQATISTGAPSKRTAQLVRRGSAPHPRPRAVPVVAQFSIWRHPANWLGPETPDRHTLKVCALQSYLTLAPGEPPRPAACAYMTLPITRRTPPLREIALTTHVLVPQMRELKRGNAEQAKQAARQEFYASSAAVLVWLVTFRVCDNLHLFSAVIRRIP